ncbi:uncharacterized protein LOC111088718 [Limulus polyphemus]|uniref:Uncharacterized protein LOC111088718 n=1 Tax=Limulus polyphemus TaxID=6850 RepID=A0ABM1THA0_LIMPO|nr:uncharacterized protein LOC111088718 [Limulus polyphemus]
MSAAVVPWGLGSRVITGVTKAKNRQTCTADPSCQSSSISFEERGTPLITPATVEEDKLPFGGEGEQMNSECRPWQVKDNSSETFSSSDRINRPTEGMKAGSIVPRGSVECPGSQSGSSYPDMEVYGGYLKPLYQDGDVILEVECGGNNGLLYLSKLCQGSKGPCIFFRDMWLTPNEFQYVSGRETAKDWKRSIRHHGKSMKLLLSKGILAVHPPDCDCKGCRISSPVVSSSSKLT